jgi:hypothetical protein
MSRVGRFTVVTVCLNARDSIRLTLESVARQTFPGMEHVIVDGGSTDGTLDILTEYPHLTVHSGPDGGVYDAMDRARPMVRGDVAIFLNAGDCFHDATTAEDIADAFGKVDADILFGNLLPVYLRAGDRHDHDSFVPGRPIDLGVMRNRRDLFGQSIHHQATVYRRWVLQKCSFRCRTAPHATGEYHLLLEASLRRGARIRHVDRLVSRFALGGQSTRDFAREWDRYVQARDTLRSLFCPTPESIRIDGPDEFHGIAAVRPPNLLTRASRTVSRRLRTGPPGRVVDRLLDAVARRVVRALMPKIADLLECQVQRLFNDLDARGRSILEGSEARTLESVEDLLRRHHSLPKALLKGLREGSRNLEEREKSLRILLGELAKGVDLRTDQPISWNRTLQEHVAAMIRHEDRLVRLLSEAARNDGHPDAGATDDAGRDRP